jgi:hydrogenase 3 maturation protease
MMGTKTALKNFLTGQVCILGYGNRMWRDDGAGSLLAEALAGNPGLDAIDGGFVPENHLEKVARNNPDTILMIDTADFGGKPGEVRLLMPEDTVLTGVSTHAGSPQMLAQYLQTRCGAKVGLLAIQPGDTSEGGALSAPVAQTLSDLTDYFEALFAAS